MRHLIILAAAMTLTINLFAQETSTVKGKITDREGNRVGYVSIGIKGQGIGTVSDSSGNFILRVPAGGSHGEMIFSHISYNEKRFCPSEYLTWGDSATVILDRNEIREAVVSNGKMKSAKLVGKGMRIAGGVMSFSPSSIGKELGSIVTVRNRFIVKEISVTATDNSIPGSRFGINIYRTDKDGSFFESVMNTPTYFTVPETEVSKDIRISLDEEAFLEPGIYFIAFTMVDCDTALRKEWEGYEDWSNEKKIDYNARYSCHFPLYLKSSYIREKDLTFDTYPVNLGISISGTEIR